MPSSDPSALWFIWDITMNLQPKSILDIWVWFGSKWAFFRELTDIRNCRYKKDKWITTIDWIEIFQDYINDLHKFVYDKILIWDCRDVINVLWDYDMIFMWDVLEHLPKEDWKKFLEELQLHSNNIIISTPDWFYWQWSVMWNDHEKHECWWSEQEFLDLWFTVNKFWILLIATIWFQK